MKPRPYYRHQPHKTIKPRPRYRSSTSAFRDTCSLTDRTQNFPLLLSSLIRCVPFGVLVSLSYVFVILHGPRNIRYEVEESRTVLTRPPSLSLLRRHRPSQTSVSELKKNSCPPGTTSYK